MMCSGSKSNLSPSNMNMEGGFQEGKNGILHKNCSKLLEFAAMDDLSSFIYEIEEKGSNIDEVSFWYGRSFGSKKMGFEQRTPIMIASLFGSMEVLKYIVGTSKIDVNRSCGSDRATPLHCAAAGGSWSSVEVAKLLIDASGDINAVDINGRKSGDLIAPCVKSCTSPKRKTLEMMLNGFSLEGGQNEQEEEIRTPRGGERKEYPVDVSLPDINNGLYGSDEFRMFSFKVKPCSRAYSHDWTECPFVHPGENARRRDPRKYSYTCVPCPEFKKGSCGKGDSCEYAHGVFESWLHPAQYRTRLCKDETGCSRKVCFFAHKPDELRPLYASTGSAMPSPKSGNSLDLPTLSPLSLGSSSMMMPNSSTPPMSPSIACSSPMGGTMWQNNMNLTPPALQFPGSRLKTTLSARDVDMHMELLGLDKISTQQRHHQHFVEEMAGLSSSPYNRMGGDLKPTNLDDVFGGSLDPSLLSQLQGHSPRVNNMNQLRASYPSNISSSPARKPAPYGFDSSAAVAAAVMNSRSNAFAKRSQSFIDRSGGSYRAGPGSSSPGFGPSKLSEWGSPDGKLEWGYNEEVNKLRKSASFGFRSGNSPVVVGPGDADEPDVSWVNSLVKDGPSGGGGGSGVYGPGPGPRQGGGNEMMQQHWIDQMYIEQEQTVA